MTTFFGILLGGLVGWLGGYASGHLIAFIVRKLDSDAPEVAPRTGGALMVVETILLAVLGGVLAHYAGLTVALVACFLALLLLPGVMFAGMRVGGSDDSELPELVFNSPVILVLWAKARFLQLCGYVKDTWTKYTTPVAVPADGALPVIDPVQPPVAVVAKETVEAAVAICPPPLPVTAQPAPAVESASVVVQAPVPTPAVESAPVVEQAPVPTPAVESAPLVHATKLAGNEATESLPVTAPVAAGDQPAK